MSDIVIMPKADYEAVCNAIRARTGKTDLIKSGDLQAEIEAITGGTSADVCYVTFLSDDGTVEYGKKAVAVGDDCADPIARGVFDTPTKESTVQYDYTFDGWALDTGGEKDNAALQAVTEDRTVYAAYISAPRYYTITYYDGNTVLKTESLAYGSTPSYKPSKDGYDFVAWEPELTTVTGEASYVATWEEKPTFATATWEEIAAVCAAGNAESTFAVGDEKAFTVTYEDGTTEENAFILAGFNNGELEDGSVASITLIAKYALETTRAMQDTYVLGGVRYYESELAAWLNSTLYNALPAELQSVIKSKNIRSSDYKEIRRCWLPSLTELQVPLAGFDDIFGMGTNEPLTLFSTDSARIRTLGANGVATSYYTRSYKDTDTNVQHKYITSEGKVYGGYSSGSTKLGIVIGICI